MKNIIFVFTYIFVSHCYSEPLRVGNPELLLKYINIHRVEHGLAPLIYDKLLENAAKMQAVYDYNTYSNLPLKSEHDLHENKIYPTKISRLNNVGYKFNSKSGICYENALRYNKLEKQHKLLSELEKVMFTDYKNSIPHNETMLNNSSTRIGIYTIYDPVMECLYNVVVFAN